MHSKFIETTFNPDEREPKNLAIHELFEKPSFETIRDLKGLKHDIEVSDIHPEWYIDRLHDITGGSMNGLGWDHKTKIINDYYRQCIQITPTLKSNLKKIFPAESAIIDLCVKGNVFHENYITSLIRESCGMIIDYVISLCTNVHHRLIGKYKKKLIRLDKTGVWK